VLVTVGAPGQDRPWLDRWPVATHKQEGIDMGLFRLLFWIALIAAAFWLWRRLTRKKTPNAQQQGSLPMVRCAQCGVHVPQDQALQAHDRWYCSQAHLEQDSTSGGH